MFDGPNVTLDEKSVAKVLTKEGARVDEVLVAVRAILADESNPWECDPLQNACRALTETLDLKAKFIFQPIRVAVTGSQVSPPLFESIELMDRNTNRLFLWRLRRRPKIREARLQGKAEQQH